MLQTRAFILLPKPGVHCATQMRSCAPLAHDWAKPAWRISYFAHCSLSGRDVRVPCYAHFQALAEAPSTSPSLREWGADLGNYLIISDPNAEVKGEIIRYWDDGWIELFN